MDEQFFREQFDKIEVRFDKIDSRFDKADERFDHLEARLNKTEVLFDSLGARIEGLEKNAVAMGSTLSRVALEVSEHTRALLYQDERERSYHNEIMKHIDFVYHQYKRVEEEQLTTAERLHRLESGKTPAISPT